MNPTGNNENTPSGLGLLLIITILVITAASAMAAPPAGLPEGYPTTERQKLSFNADWRFQLGDVEGKPEATEFDDSAWTMVTLPHTLKLTSLDLDNQPNDIDFPVQKTFHREMSWYRRHFTVDAEKDAKVFLEFEGAHQITELWVNGQYVGKHMIGGYTPFHFDVTDFVKRGGEDNVAAIKLDNTFNPDIAPDGGRHDYVLFGGIYRDVYLVVTDRLHVTFPWEKREAGVFITTPSVKKNNATVSVRTTVRNEYDSPRDCSLLTRIIDAEGRVIRKLKTSATIAPGADYTFSQVDGITQDLRLWSFDDPYLYRVHTTVLDGDQPVDMAENTLGVRWFELREGVGFLMNGEEHKLIGTNRHQQYPYVGDAVPNGLHWKDAVQFKKAGFNLIRLAHYPHDNSFFDACDKLGMLIAEEMPAWNDLGSEAWMNSLEESLRVTIRNHRNHPSVVIWAGGVNHKGTIRRLHYAAKDEDPTRWTQSNNAAWGGLQAAGVSDIFSTMDYSSVAETDTWLFAMEHSSSADAERNQVLVSRYKGSPGRFAMTLWSAHDYNTFRPKGGPINHMSRGGKPWDSFRTPRPVAYWYQSELTTEPMIFIADNWNDPKIERVRVFSNCDEVELFINGFSQGRRVPDDDPNKINLNRPPFTFRIVFEAGELTAKGLIDGEVKIVHTIRTPEKPDHLTLRIDTDRPAFMADGSDMVVAYAHIEDRNGQRAIDSAQQVTFSIEGPGEIVGDSSIRANPMTAEHGIAPVLIRAGTTPGRIRLTASATGLREAIAEVTTVAFNANAIAANAQPIYELAWLQADIGQDGQQIEDGWTTWSISETQNLARQFEELGGGKVEIGTMADGGTVAWFGENGTPGPLGRLADDGVKAPASEGLRLTLTDLAEGTYEIKTYHHVPGNNPGPSQAMRVSVNDADGAARSAVTGLAHSVGRRLGNATPAHSNFTFRSNGQDPVVIRFAGAGEEGEVWLNGLDIRETL